MIDAEFIQLLSSEANELASKDNKSTITPVHVERALDQLGFEDWAKDVKQHHEEYKKDQKGMLLISDYIRSSQRLCIQRCFDDLPDQDIIITLMICVLARESTPT